METKQTAVEWLFDKITQNKDIRWRGTQYLELFEQAKAMEKEQMIQFADDWKEDCLTGTYDGDTCELKSSEQYYKETYGN